MCLTLNLKHLACGHEESYVRPCRRNSIRCNMMSAHTRTLEEEVCRNCWILLDFRQALVIDQSYQTWNLVAEALDLQTHLQNLPFSSLPNQYAHFHSTNIVTFDLLNQNAMGLLYNLVHDGLDPAFQMRVTDGEDIPLVERTTALNMHQILLINQALLDASEALSDYDWRIAMGHRVFIDFANSRHFTRLVDLQAPVDDCSICVDPLNHRDEGEMNTAIVKTICNHMYHERCLEQWFVSSARGDCPYCRILLRITELPQIPIRQEVEGPLPDWLAILIECLQDVGAALETVEVERVDELGVPGDFDALGVVRHPVFISNRQILFN
ncbi:putative ring-h2 finger protein [Botrytis fragariae]|uniref:Putative ring-h2 finger protein n=1 Tax=Botrytis fragariae TaxID=1964551 RepID=A0A8H6AV68_9HELO|nr:putative ring-h2 finger protein [Botrytis fragariae]KAF5874183.1 putative ring-h2 finger protein [Botrytis fragariae]